MIAEDILSRSSGLPRAVHFIAAKPSEKWYAKVKKVHCSKNNCFSDGVQVRIPLCHSTMSVTSQQQVVT